MTGLDEDIKEIKRTIEYERGVRAVKYDGLPKSERIAKPTEENAVKNIDRFEEEIKELNRMILSMKENKQEVERFLATLEAIEYRLVSVRYLRKKSWEAVALRIHLSSRQCYRVHNKILEKMCEYFDTSVNLP